MSIQAKNSHSSQFKNLLEIENRSIYSRWTPKIINTIHNLAIPMIALYALSNIPGAQAGPMAYGLCVEACFAAAGWWFPPAIPVCVAGCIPLLLAPGP